MQGARWQNWGELIVLILAPEKFYSITQVVSRRELLYNSMRIRKKHPKVLQKMEKYLCLKDE